MLIEPTSRAPFLPLKLWPSKIRIPGISAILVSCIEIAFREKPGFSSFSSRLHGCMLEGASLLFWDCGKSTVVLYHGVCCRCRNAPSLTLSITVRYCWKYLSLFASQNRAYNPLVVVLTRGSWQVRKLGEWALLVHLQGWHGSPSPCQAPTLLARGHLQPEVCDPCSCKLPTPFN
jgi:hypothetical protein